MMWAELAGLCALAIAEPIFEEILQTPEIMALLEIRGRETAVFLFVMVTVPPTLLWSLELAIGMVWPRLRHIGHAVVVSLLVASMAWQAAHGDGLEEDQFARLVLIGSFCVVLFVYLRTKWLPAVTRGLAFAMPVVVAMFLMSPQVSRSFTSENVTPGQRNGPAVVLVVFDELPLATLVGPDGRIDERLFPNFAQLAQGATWYPNTYTVADITIRAVPAILSGQFPGADRAGTQADYPRNLFTLFGGPVLDGEYLTNLCGPPICPNRYTFSNRITQLMRIGGGLAVTLPFVPNDAGIGKRQFRKLAEQGYGHPRGFDAFVNALRTSPADRYSLGVFHESLPHRPWTYLPSGQKYLQPTNGGLESDASLEVMHEIELGFQRHVLQAQFVDRQLGDLMDAMRRSALYDEAILAVTADHGVSFFPNTSLRKLSATNSGWLLPVPLFIKGVEQRVGVIDTASMRTIDILPTLAEAAGVQAPWELDGRLAGAPRDPAIDSGYLSLYGTRKIEPSVVERSFNRAVERRNAMLPSGNPFVLGGSGELVGERVASLDLDRVPSTLDQGAFDDVDPDAPSVAAYASGTLSGFAGGPGAPIAFVLNGRIVATGEAFEVEGQLRFATALPVRFMRKGSNRFAIYELGERSTQSPP